MVLNVPLSADHRLLTIVQFNALRGFLFNMSILSLLHHFPPGCPHSLNIPRFNHVTPSKIPVDLRPTLIQQSKPHPFWMDTLPFPRIRDNMIFLAGTYDEDDLYSDLGRDIYEGFEDTERRGFVSWKDPWSADGWEISDGFAKKWGFLLAGCSEEIALTNKWRRMRDEEDLVVELE